MADIITYLVIFTPILTAIYISERSRDVKPYYKQYAKRCISARI